MKIGFPKLSSSLTSPNLSRSTICSRKSYKKISLSLSLGRKKRPRSEACVMVFEAYGLFDFDLQQWRTAFRFEASKILSNLRTKHSNSSYPDTPASSNGTAQLEQTKVEVAEGYTITQFCDKIIELFMNENPQPKEWRKLLVFSEEWSKYRENFYARCRSRADSETGPDMKQKLLMLGN